jgi:hypothetical protein
MKKNFSRFNRFEFNDRREAMKKFHKRGVLWWRMPEFLDGLNQSMVKSGHQQMGKNFGSLRNQEEEEFTGAR